PTQKIKNVLALHEAYEKAHPGKKILEISSKSQQEGGKELSAFNLMIYVPSLGRSVTVECAYQGGKVFAAGGPYLDLLEATSREAKKDERLKTSGALKDFEFEGRRFGTNGTDFYDYLYIKALTQNPELAAILMEYNGFTDIEFSPSKGRACQAAAAAKYVSLVKQGLLDEYLSKMEA
ncbi:MAG: hypothetical protein IJF53_06395, partial [Clostridia bacterium]|nr:hypothetical protein [Clostridia bacterium]